MQPLSRSFSWTWAHLVQDRDIADGVSATLLWHDETGNVALLLTFVANAVLTKLASTIPLAIEIFVLSGMVADEHRTYTEGTFIHMPGDGPRAFASPCGCRLFVFMRESKQPSGSPEVAARDASRQVWGTLLPPVGSAAD